MSTITTCGTATIDVAPDRATVDLGITEVAVDAAAALAAVAGRGRRLENALTTLGFGTGDWTTIGVTLAEEWEWRKETNTRIGHRATTGIMVRVTALDTVAPLLQAAVDDAGAQIRGLSWHVSSDHPARTGLLGDAARDARRRAESYAAALGLQVGGIDEISETPISSGPQASAEPMAMRAAKGGAADISVNAGVTTLSASVFVRFSALPLP